MRESRYEHKSYPFSTCIAANLQEGMLSNLYQLQEDMPTIIMLSEDVMCNSTIILCRKSVVQS